MLRRACAIRVWPEPPAAGELVRLPLPCPAQLVALSHYRGDRRWIALWSSPADDELIVSDGALTITGRSHGWSCFCAHPLVGVFLEPYRLDQPHDRGEHRLLVDRYLGSLHVGLGEDVDQLLAAQPPDLAADAEQLLPAGRVGTRTSVMRQWRRYYRVLRPLDQVASTVEQDRWKLTEADGWAAEDDGLLQFRRVDL